jgi:hypothetical protein
MCPVQDVPMYQCSAVGIQLLGRTIGVIARYFFCRIIGCDRRPALAPETKRLTALINKSVASGRPFAHQERKHSKNVKIIEAGWQEWNADILA